MKTKHLFLLFFLGLFSVMLTAPQKQKRSRSRSSTKRSSGGRGKRSAGGRGSRGKKGSSGSRGGGGGSIITQNFTPAPSVLLEPLTADRIKKSTVVLSKEDLNTLKNTQALLQAKKETLKKDKDDLTYIKDKLEAKLKKEKIIKTA